MSQFIDKVSWSGVNSFPAVPLSNAEYKSIKLLILFAKDASQIIYLIDRRERGEENVFFKLTRYM